MTVIPLRKLYVTCIFMGAKFNAHLQSLPEYDETFKTIETYEGLTVEYLSVRLVFVVRNYYYSYS